jgi:hypothetical protein
LASLALAGCSAPAAAPAPTVTATVTVEAAPIPAASVPSADAATPTRAEDTALFLKSAKFRWVGTPPADEILISAGKLACKQMLSGTDVTAVKVVEASGAQDQSLAVAVAAQDGLCPETIR